MATERIPSTPTPPLSPQNMRMPHTSEEDALKTTGNLVDSLVAYYQHEKMWVYRTRAALENAFPPPPPMHGTMQQQQQHQLHRSYSADGRGNGLPVPMGPQGPFQDLERGAGAGGEQDGKHSPSRWKARKKGFKLSLEGIRSKRVISTQSSDQLQPQEQILEMYERMMEARMQSCQRVSKLIQDANRAHLHHR